MPTEQETEAARLAGRDPVTGLPLNPSPVVDPLTGAPLAPKPDAPKPPDPNDPPLRHDPAAPNGPVNADTGRTFTAEPPPVKEGNVDPDLTGKQQPVIFSKEQHVDRNAPAPLIDRLDRTRFEFAGGETLTIYGSGFTDAAEVRFANIPGENLDVVSDNEITVVIPRGSQRGPVTVSVVTPAGVTDPSPAAYI